MAVDPVPYVVHGAKHSADVFRQAHHDSTNGGQGVSLAGDLKVEATATPSNQVRVAPGGATIVNTSQGGAGQSYSFRNASETLVSVPPSDSTGARNWWIIAEVVDPQFGGPAPADPLVGPYAFLRCVSTSDFILTPHIKLAHLYVPASTATIQQSMIYERRVILNPIISTPMHSRPRVTADNSPQNNLTAIDSNGGEFFPGGAGYANEVKTTIPEDAHSMIIVANWLSVRYQGGKNCYGSFWVEFGDEYRNHTWPYQRQYEFATQAFMFDTVATGNTMRTNWRASDTVAVPSKLRGVETTFVFKAGLNANADTGVSMDAMSGLDIQVMFSRSPVGVGGFIG